MKVLSILAAIFALSFLGWFIWAFITEWKQDKESSDRGDDVWGFN